MSEQLTLTKLAERGQGLQNIASDTETIGFLSRRHPRPSQCRQFLFDLALLCADARWKLHTRTLLGGEWTPAMRTVLEKFFAQTLTGDYIAPMDRDSFFHLVNEAAKEQHESQTLSQNLLRNQVANATPAEREEIVRVLGEPPASVTQAWKEKDGFKS